MPIPVFSPHLLLWARCAALATTAAWLHAGKAQAATMTYDSVAGTAGVQDGTTFAWRVGGANWRSSAGGGTDNQNWGDGNDAVFGGGTSGAAGTVNLGGSVSANSLTFIAPASGNYTLANGGKANRTLTLTSGLVTANANASISAVIAGSSGLTKEGAGTLTLSGTNTFTGATTVSAGVLSVATIGNGGVAGNLGQATNAASNLVLGGGTLRYTGATASTDRAFTLAAGTTSTLEVTAAGTSLTMSGASAATTGALTKTGAGTLTLSANNLFTGAVTVNAGTLVGNGTNSSSSAFGKASSITVNNGATLLSGNSADNALVGYANATPTLVLNAGGTLGAQGASTTNHLSPITLAGGTLAGAAALSGSSSTYGRWNLDNTVTVQAGTNATSTLSSLGMTLSQTGGTQFVVNASGAASGMDLDVTGSFYHAPSAAITDTGLVKSGAGTMRLSGANTYTGTTTVSSGTLVLTGTHASAGANTSYTVGTGAYAGTPVATLAGKSTGATQTIALTGTGTTNLVSIAGNGAITAGSTAAAGSTVGTHIGTFNITADKVSLAGTYLCDLDFNALSGNQADGTKGDLIQITGDVDITGAHLALRGANIAPAQGTKYAIKLFAWTGTATGAASDWTPANITGLQAGQSVVRWGNAYYLVPEPASLILLSLGCLLLLRRPSRRRGR